MRMLKFWMVLSSVVLGMAIPTSRSYSQEEMVEEVAIESNDLDSKVEVNQDIGLSQQEATKNPTAKIEGAPTEVVQGDVGGGKEQLSEELAALEQEVTDIPVGEVQDNQAEAIKEKTGVSNKIIPSEQIVPVISTEKVNSLPSSAISGDGQSIVAADEKLPAKELEPIGEDEEDVEIESIDTIDLSDPQGNWLIKRYWFNQSEQLYGQMSQRVQRIFDFGSDFQQKSVELDQKLFDPFYLDIGIGRGELTELVNSLIEQLTENDHSSVERNQEELEYFQQLEEKKRALERLKADIEGISDIDEAVNNALATFNERANLSRNYHSKAWHFLQEIAHELNDKKARTLYFTIKSLARSVVDIEEYITSPFLQYFDELSDKADEQINRIKQEVVVLKQKGIDLKEKVSELENAQQNEELEEAAQQGYDTAEQEQKQREKREPGFFSGIGGMVQDMWNTFYSFLQKLFASATKQTVQVKTERREVSEQEILKEEPAVEMKEVELELASDAEQQEAMTAGTEEIELIKASGELVGPEKDMPSAQAEEAGLSLQHVEEVHPAMASDQKSVTPSAELELEREQAQ